MNATQGQLRLGQRDGQTERVTQTGGLPGSLAQIYAEHFALVWRNARRLGVPESSAEDVVQEVFVVMHRRRADFRGGAIRPWIFGILCRVVRDHHRTHRRKLARWIPLTHDNELSSEVQPPSPSALAEQAERTRLLEALLMELSEDQRTLIVLSELEQWTLKEIAEFSGSRTSTVFQRLRLAKQQLAKAYKRAAAKRGEEL